MSKDINDITQNIISSNKELFEKLSDVTTDKEVKDIKNRILGLEKKISKIDTTLEQVFEMLNNITVFIEDAEDNEPELDDEEDWTPYDDRNFTYDDDDDEPYEDEWNNHEDES